MWTHTSQSRHAWAAVRLSRACLCLVLASLPSALAWGVGGRSEGPQSGRPSTHRQHNPGYLARDGTVDGIDQPEGFYIHPGSEHLYQLAVADSIQVTDKVTAHNYQTIYAKYFQLCHRRRHVHKFLEIGLGCNIHSGSAVGASARLWRRYLPLSTDVWFAEYDQECIRQRQDILKMLDIQVVTGDQADPATLDRWVKETGGNFDVIIDDGGHTNKQQWQSFFHLFQKALKPGGLYVIEDLSVSPTNFGDTPCKPSEDTSQCRIMTDMLGQWIQFLTMRWCDAVWAEKPERKPNPFYSMVPGIKTIECSAEACVITKCYENDATCVYPGCEDPVWKAKSPWKDLKSKRSW